MSIKLHLGCGNIVIPGWINIDKYNKHADIKADIVSLQYQDVDEIYTSHTIEHLLPQEFEEALRNWYRILKPNGILIIRCPNSFVHIQRWLDATDEQRYAEPGVQNSVLGFRTRGPGYFNHNLFTPGLLKRCLIEAGFIVLECKDVTCRVDDFGENLIAGKADRGEIFEGKMKSDIWCRAIKRD